MSNNQMYVYFNKETGELIEITSFESNQEQEYILVEKEKVNKLLEGFEKFEDYIVSYNLIKKNYILLKKASEDLIIKNKFIRVLPNNIYDIRIVQDFKEQHWKIEFNEELKQVVIHHQPVVFSVVENNDPNFILRKFDITTEDLLNNKEIIFPFEFDWEFNQQKVKVYTVKYFEDYSYEIEI